MQFGFNAVGEKGLQERLVRDISLVRKAFQVVQERLRLTRRREIVCIEGFSLGKEGVSALLQSMKSAESWVCQKRLSSVSFLKFGIFFFMIDTFPVLASGAYAQWRTDNIVSGKKTKARCLPASGGAEGDQGLCYIYS